MKKLIKLFVLLVMTLSVAIAGTMAGYAAFGLPDGGAEDAESKTLSIIDFSSMASIQSAGFVPSGDHTKDGKFSAYWNHNNKAAVDLRNIPTDWSEYYELNLSMFTKNGGGTKFVIVAVCDTGYFMTTITAEEGQHDYAISFGNIKAQPGASWDKIKYVRFSANGWSMTPSLNAEYWINSFHIKKIGEGIERLYPSAEVEAAYHALDGNAAVYAGGRQVVSGEKVTPYKDILWKNDVTYIPADLFKDYFGAAVSVKNTEGEISVNHAKLTVRADSKSYTINGIDSTFQNAPYIENGTLYVPGQETAELLGYQTKVDKRLLILGDSKVRDFDSYSKVSNMREIAGYLAYHEDVDPKSISKDEMKLAKDRWRYSLVGDESVDLNDASIKEIVRQIGLKGKGAWSLMDKSRSDSLFLGRAAEKSTDMTSEYTQIYYMALAWAQYGSEYYHNEKLLDDILYALDWMFENRYGYDEIKNEPGTVWRDHTLTNWYDWQIATPQILTNTMMLVEDYLTPEQITDYLAFFQYWVHDRCYNSMHVDAGMNVLYTDKNWIGSSLLRGDAEDLLDAVSCLHNCFSWADTFSTREGFYSDGSYVFHYKHPMSAQYGMQQFELSGPILSIISGTSFDFKNPRRENIFDWIYDAYEPIIYDGAIFRYVKGRSVTSSDHGYGKQFIKGVLNLLEFADSENAAKMKSLIKYNVITEKATNYSDSTLSVHQRQQIMDIMRDDNIKPREDYYISKTYYNMDKIAHQRKTWALGISMSSSRIYDYECIHGANLTGWYTSDGMTQLMLQNDQKQFTSNYWNNVDPYKYPGITVDTQKRDEHTINTGNAFVKDFDFVGGATIDGEYTTAAQRLNAFHLDHDITQSDGAVIKAHNSTLVAQKSWFCFDDEVVCLGAGINANDGFDVRTIVENRKANKMESLIPEDLVTQELEVKAVEASQTPQAENTAENTIDRDYGSKWAGEGECNITYDLGEVKTVGMAGFAFQNGNKRTQKIDIDISTDGETWTKVFSGNSGGQTEGLEIFDLKNCSARYVRLDSYGNSDGGGWISLTEAAFYGEYSGTEAKVVNPVYVAAEKINVNGDDITLGEEEYTTTDAVYVSMENVAGYYFPEKGSLTMRKTSGMTSFFEMWLNHGVSPKGQGYAYVILPNMTAEQTKQYAENPGIEILCNTDKISAVHDKSTGTTGVVFWEPGTFDGFTVAKPMILMYKETAEGLSLVVSDPTHKLAEETIQTDRVLGAASLDYRTALTDDGTAIKINFTGSDGESIALKLRKGETAAKKMYFSDQKGNVIGYAGAGQSVTVTADADVSEEDTIMQVGQYAANHRLVGIDISDYGKESTNPRTMQVTVRHDAAVLRGFLWRGLAPVCEASALPITF